MKTGRAKFWLPAVGLALLAADAISLAQSVPVGHATDFTSESYYDSPHEQQVKIRLSGASALPLPDGLLDIKQMRVETFAMDGKPELVARAPQCIYALAGGVANSAGHIELQTADGRIRMEGDGFLSRQSDNSLTISNHVYTVIKPGAWKLNKP